ncbi:MAG: amino acid permease [Verrucomicrobia bacterium]|nr:amino acid permease [Verrucomicrobiota bacterium]
MSEMVIQGSRPRNVGWLRAAALLYGDWGTSKAYVIGLAVLLAGYAAPVYLVGIVALTFLVGWNYINVCRLFPHGGGVYHSAHLHSPRLAVIGALLLLADYIVTASLSCYEAFNYFETGDSTRWAILAVFGIGALNYFGPRFSSALAVYLAAPTVICVLALVTFGIAKQPELQWHWPEVGFLRGWELFAGMVLALSGVEAIANTTGVMKLDPGSTPEQPSIHRAARKAIGLVMLEVCLVTLALGILAAGMPAGSFLHPEAFLRRMAEHYVHPAFGVVMGWTVGLLLLSAVNTAVVAMVALLYSLAQNGDLPPVFKQLNSYGVPWVPLIAATGLPILILDLAPGLEALASLYAIGVVGAITLNLWSTSTAKGLPLSLGPKFLMMATALLMAAIWVTIAATKMHALIFVVLVCGVGLFIRETYRTKTKRLAEALVVPGSEPSARLREEPASAEEAAEESGRILVAARGMTAAARFALDEAKLRGARLYFLFVREVQVATEVSGKLENDAEAQRVFAEIRQAAVAEKILLTPIYCVSNQASDMITELAATLGADLVVLGGSKRKVLVNLLRGDTVQQVSHALPEEIRLVVVG